METMKQFRYFTIFNHKKEEDYLIEKHKSGWKFTRVSGLGVYHFEKCEPKDVVYQLDYNPQTKDTKQEYLQMFADCGWDYIQDYEPLQIWYRNNLIGTDCGAAYLDERLACLRLDDMKEFYSRC